ncbi:MAG: LysM peptidoglycan-binding domain-containing protein [Lactovum sp.]
MAKYTPKHLSAIEKGEQKVTKKTMERGIVTGTMLATAIVPTVFNPQTIAYANTATDREAFISEVGTFAQEIADNNGLYASVMIAQAIHESNWGQSQLASAPYYNFFGIKGSYQGQSVNFPTQEYLDGQWLTVDANFRSYPSYRESLEDNAKLLRTTNFGDGYYYAGAWKENTSSYLDATSYLTGRYATDPNYANALNLLIASYDLTRFDSPSLIETSDNISNAESFNYTVKENDTLSKIAELYQLTVKDIKSFNQLSSDAIYSGQVLKIPGSQAETEISQPSNSNNSLSIDTNSGEYSMYTIVEGDSLWKIALQHQVSIEQIKNLNNLSSDTIHVNQTLKIPTNKKQEAEIPKIDLDLSSDTKSNENTSEVPRIDLDLSNSAKATEEGKAESSDEDKINIELEEKVEQDKIEETVEEIIPEEIIPEEIIPEETKQVETFNYTVKSGDTLWSLANYYQTTVEEIKILNMLTFDTIYNNQSLRIPKSQAITEVEQEQTTLDYSENISEDELFNYTVQAGDSLWALAETYDSTIALLKQLNGLTKDNIYVHQKLVIPKNFKLLNSSPLEHTVKAGDTLWDLAQRYQTSVDELKELNNLSSSLIFVGQTLKVQ